MKIASKLSTLSKIMHLNLPFTLDLDQYSTNGRILIVYNTL